MIYAPRGLQRCGLWIALTLLVDSLEVRAVYAALMTDCRAFFFCGVFYAIGRQSGEMHYIYSRRYGAGRSIQHLPQ